MGRTLPRTEFIESGEADTDVDVAAPVTGSGGE
jgi:hypothetical protein